MWIEGTPSWMQPIFTFLKDHTLPEDKEKANKLRRRATHYIFKTYKRGFSSPFLRCTSVEETNYVLREVREGVCGNHT